MGGHPSTFSLFIWHTHTMHHTTTTTTTTTTILFFTHSFPHPTLVARRCAWGDEGHPEDRPGQTSLARTDQRTIKLSTAGGNWKRGLGARGKAAGHHTFVRDSCRASGTGTERRALQTHT